MPVSVPAAAVTVMLAVPSKDTPLIVLAVCRAVAVPALPVTEVWSPVFVPLCVPFVIVAEPLTVRVCPSAMVSVEPVAGAVIATLFIVVADATPSDGVTSDGDCWRTGFPDPVGVEFLMIFPVVPLNSAGTSAVELAGPTTSPDPAPPVPAAP